MESDVRTHRMLSPNRRPLLISALLVALTSVPTLIVVAAGSATLDTAPSVRTPIVAEPHPGPLVLAPTPSSGLHGAGTPTHVAEPTAPLPPATVVKPRASGRTSGGSGGGVVVGTGSKPPTVAPAPPSSPAPEVQEPPAVVPTPSPTKGVPIQDKAWPGWDARLKGRPEAVKRWAGHRPRSGSADRSDLEDCPSEQV
ncbi:hypothetical protein [Dactylosporangium sp. NPDC000521]|uniref:hypothetical protein n=1 Tax=Dactylosporangium sp. NPDC000521 TaxID=3363975 RepID=UPI00368E585A